ncbi:MAG: beta-ketoacyl-ACP synthase III [Actinomycetes bacterium]
MTGLRVTGWGTAVPERIVTNDDLSATLDTSDEWIADRTGIRQRHVGGSTAGLGAEAGRQALDRAGITAADIDFVLLATTTPDQVVPGTAPAIQDALGITGGAMDVNAACSGFVYALVTASGLLATGGIKRILLIGAETLSRFVDWEDRTMAVLLGDGAGALVLEATDDEGDLLSWNLGSDGSLKHLLYCDHGSTMQMDGKEVFRRAVRIVVESANKAVADAGLTIDDIDLLVPHQANLRIIRAASTRLGMDEERVAVVIERYGNTSSASIPLALADALEHGRVTTGDTLLLTGFGGGMTWASAVLRWSL